MSDYLLRQLLFLAEPIGFVWLALLVLTAWLWRKGPRTCAAFSGLLAIFMTLIGSTSLPPRLLATLENPYAGITPEMLPTADAIVLLGGGAAPSAREAGGVHLTPAADRLVMAHALFKLGKAPVLVIGGNATQLGGVTRLESELMRDLLVAWGLPAEAMLPLAACADTHDEALQVRALAAARGWRRLLLVTSANHQRRALATFRTPGLEVLPAPCNFFTGIRGDATAPRLSVPRSEGFVLTATWLHEQAGWFIYHRRGWIAD